LLCPAVFLRRVGNGDEDLRHADLAGEPINDDRNAVAGVIDEQPLTGGVRASKSRSSSVSNSRAHGASTSSPSA
jgi:hypothetical protein